MKYINDWMKVATLLVFFFIYKRRLIQLPTQYYYINCTIMELEVLYMTGKVIYITEVNLLQLVSSAQNLTMLVMVSLREAFWAQFCF